MQDISWDVSPLAAAIRLLVPIIHFPYEFMNLLVLQMFKLEDVAMGIWITDLKKNGLEVRSFKKVTELFVLEINTLTVIPRCRDEFEWRTMCGGVGDSSSSSFEILIVGIGPLSNANGCRQEQKLARDHN
nr:beta-1,3-galactosyltransferase GALT1 [Tanacetum cinerariifolium]